MSLPKKNIVANFIGQAWTGLISIIFIPVYIKYMGIEAYGLVGFFATVQSLFIIVDMGLTTTMSREVARLSSLSGTEDEIYSTSLTLEWIYWILAALFGLVVVGSAPFIASKWLNIEHITTADATSAISLMGISIILQLPSSVYSGGLIGWKRQVTLNKINVLVATVRVIGALLVLSIFSNKIVVFFTWQIAASAIQTLLMRYNFKRLLSKPVHHGIKFKETVAKIWRFTAGVSGTTFMALIFMQIDKVVISKFLSLKMFAYYSLASSLSATVYRAVAPITSVVMPRFTELIMQKDEEGLKQTYHNACQLVSFLIMPPISVGVLFSHEILSLWTRDAAIADNTSMILSLLLIGTMFNALYHIPYNLQLAYGWNKLGLYSTSICAILVVPMTFFAIIKFGPLGAASVWIILNSWYILLVIPIMHSRVLKAEKFAWYTHDVFTPLLASFSVTILWRLLSIASANQYVPYTTPVIRSLSFVSVALVSAYLVTAFFTEYIRENIRKLRFSLT